MNLKSFIFVLFLSALSHFSIAQEAPKIEGNYVSAYVQNGDTIPVVFLHSLYISDNRVFKSKQDERKYNRLMRNVVTVYPYAKKAAELLNHYEAQMVGETDKRVIKGFYKQVEKDLRSEYEDDLYNMTISQGRILVKLIDRETGATSYELIEHFRGMITAFFFQGVARMFGQDLKNEYDAVTEDRMIEDIILMIEKGELKLASNLE